MAKRVFTWMMAAICGAALTAGCGGDEPAEQMQDDPLKDSKGVCAYENFDATVTEGPSAGLKAEGTLTLIEEMDGTLSGKLESKDAMGAETSIPVTGKITDLTIDLTFTLADGGKISGTGALPTPFEQCGGPTKGMDPGPKMEGTLTGPKAGDKGNWGGYGSRCFNDCRLIGGGFYECLVGCALFY